MTDVCGMKQTPHRLWRNGMDYEPKKPLRPDYSNVPSVRDWQMSPFAQERFDLDEIQRAEKKGFKGRFELEKLKKKYGVGDPCGSSSSKAQSGCEECAKREANAQLLSKKKVRCTDNVLYQPYGPVVLSSLSYNRPDLGRPRMYSYMGPSFYSGFQFKTPAPEMTPTVPCSDYVARLGKIKNVYVPYGPYGELRMFPDMYTPMGPSVLPLNLAF